MPRESLGRSVHTSGLKQTFSSSHMTGSGWGVRVRVPSKARAETATHPAEVQHGFNATGNRIPHILKPEHLERRCRILLLETTAEFQVDISVVAGKSW